MRRLRTIVLIPLAAFSVFFLIDYVRELYPLYRVFHDPVFVFIREPYIGYYPGEHSADGRAHLSLVTMADGEGEGTCVVYYFPTWPLVLAAAGILVYSSFTIFQRRPNKSLQPTRGDALGLSRSRGLFYIAVPAWLSSSR